MNRTAKLLLALVVSVGLGQGAGTAVEAFAAESPEPAPPQPPAATLRQWLEGKEVIEVWFVGPHIEPLKLRDSLHLNLSRLGQDFQLIAGEGGGHGSFLRLVMQVTPENILHLLALQAELAPRQYLLCSDESRVWSTSGDPARRAEARKRVPEVLSALENQLAKIAPTARFTPVSSRVPSRLHEFRYDLGAGDTGSVRVVEITPRKTWETEIMWDQQLHLAQLGLMVTAYYRSGASPTSAELSSRHQAIRKAFSDAVAPLRELEPSAQVVSAPFFPLRPAPRAQGENKATEKP